ncbi:MAG: DNA methyltransferase [Micropepsaceae bacterium]
MPKTPHGKRAGKDTRKFRFDRDELSEHFAAKGRKRRATLASRAGAERKSPPRNDLRPKLDYVDVAVAALKPSPRHTRKVTQLQVARLKRSIEAFGVVMPILIAEDRTIIAGHAVRAAAKALGLATLPCVIAGHLKPIEQEKLAIAINRAGETGTWDFEALKDVLEDLIEEGDDLSDTLFEDAELDGLLLEDADALDLEDGDDGAEIPPEKPAFVTSAPGDIWVLGRHLVGCGDARDGAFLAELMGTELAEMAFLDAPYNVPIKGHVTGADHHPEFVMAAGEMSRDAFFTFLGKSHRALKRHVKPGGIVFSCMDWRSIHILMAAAEKAGYAVANLVVWNKTNAGLGSFYRSQHELILVLRVPGARSINNIQLGKNGRYRTNVWTYPGGSSLGSETRAGLTSHSTPKNPAMVEDAIEDVTTRTGIVMDSFLGGGTTLIAAERSGRRFRGGDLDPGYVDVALLRWMAETGGMPVLRDTGETFEAVRARRMAGGGAPRATHDLPRISSRGRDTEREPRVLDDDEVFFHDDEIDDVETDAGDEDEEDGECDEDVSCP